MSTEPCGAVPPPSIYGRGVYVAPCTLAPGHSGTHLPGNMDELNRLARERKRSTNPPVYPGTQSSVPRGPAIDVEHEHTPAARSVDIRHATENAERALAILAEDVEALNYTDAARAARRAEQAVERIWGKAKHSYQRWAGASRGDRFQAIIPWDMLPQDVRDMWFGLADDRVPPTWDELTPDQRADFSQRHARQALSPAQIHAQKRARGLRRRAYRQIEHANPYTVRSPEQRMSDVAATAQTLSWAKAERAAGRMNDLQFEVWAEHHRRAYHAYTRPTDPYPEAP